MGEIVTPVTLVEVEPVPAPVTVMVFIPPEVRFRVKERLPEKVLAESGRKVTWNVALAPEGSPLTLKFTLPVKPPDALTVAV